jgi:hypothetical protein
MSDTACGVGEGTHYACDCIVRRLAKLEADLAAERAARAAAEAEARMERAKYEGAVSAIPVVVAKETERLKEAARAMLGASEFGVSEAEGMRRARILADLVGFRYDAAEKPRGLPTDPQAASADAYRLAALLSAEVEAPGTEWAFALFLYRDPKDGRMGDVIQVSRDREKTLLAVARWVKDSLEAKGIKGAKS